MLIFLGEKLVGANFYAFCNYGQEGHVATVLTLLQHGADQFLPQEPGGALPIHSATQKNFAAVVEVLLDHGCSVNQVSHLHFAEEYKPLLFRLAMLMETPP